MYSLNVHFRKGVIPMHIRTNHNWHEFKCRAEVPVKILTNQFDWMIPKSIRDKPELVKKWCRGIDGPEPELEDNTGDYWDGFFCYRGYWEHTSEYTRITENTSNSFTHNIPKGDPLGYWDGIKHDSMSTGTLIKLDKDGERYQVASYRS